MVSLADVLKKKQERAERSDRPDVNWFSLNDNNPARVRFLQEIDPDAPHYEESKGSALFLVEHVSPQDFRRKAECTMETEGRCFACEMNQEEPKANWWAKTNFYVQVLDAKDDKVKILSRPAPGTFFDALFEWATDENNGSVVADSDGKAVTFNIRKGPNKTDSWVPMPTNKHLEVPEGTQLVDLTKAIGVKVEYEKQRNFYLPKGSNRDDTPSEKSQPVPKADAELSW
jgi:hypothetical protein